MQTKKFQKRIEDFVCGHCNKRIKGGGYTDHCPYCLWSRHMDINPGDRDCECQGIMKPMGVEVKKGKWILHYRCQKCGFKFKVKTGPDDNFEEILKLAGKPLK